MDISKTAYINACQHNDQKRICEESHLKLLKDHPNHMKPRWNIKQTTVSTNYGDFNIEGNK